MPKTKIICTLGPASSDYDTLKAMVEAGMDIARLNFSHGDHKTHLKNIGTIHKVSADLKRPIGILMDLQGPKIRVGEVEEDTVLVSGAKTVITTQETIGTAERFSSQYKGLPADVKEGDFILINDGLLRLQVDRVNGREIYCTVIDGGSLKSHKGINLPNASISAPALTQKDIQDLDFGLSQEVDYIALSFVREASDVKEVKGAVRRTDKNSHVVAKIERHEAVDELEEIVMASDAVMVARGDLGVEIPLEKVPLLQKSIIHNCSLHLKPVITATQMLESIIENPRPTRAEVSDIANAILDGTDALMLSGETSVGKYPVEAVKTMARIAETVEARLTRFPSYISGAAEHGVSNSIAHAACQLAENLKAKAIVCFTEYGFTAKVLSKYRQPLPVIAVTASEFVQRRLALYWGVESLLMAEVASTDEMISLVEKAAVAHGFVAHGDVVVILAGLPMPITGPTNLIKVHRIGESYAV